MIHLLSRGDKAVLDSGDTGTGKTYVALAALKALGHTPLIICPKAGIPQWKRVAGEMGADVLDVLNPEKLKTGKYPYVKRGTKKNEWMWSSVVKSVVFDECHRFSGIKTENAWLLAHAKRYGIICYCASATAAESPLKMRALGFLLGLHAWNNFWEWAKANGCYENPWGGLEFARTFSERSRVLTALHNQIFPEHGVRMRIRDIPEFPDNEVCAEAYELSDRATKETEKAYEEAEDEIQSDQKTNPLVILLRARQKAELCKVDLLADMAEDLLDEDNKSVVIFTAFRETQRMLTAALSNRLVGDTVSQIHGDQNPEERERSIQAFQLGSRRVILVMIQAGGVSISLHDTVGDRPRVALICPTYSAVEMKQALGRVHRANGKSKSMQRIIFAAGTVEAKACEAVRRKIANLDLLLDGDLSEGIRWQEKK
jgi:hypothetical protein